MKKTTVEINNKTYNVQVAETDEEKARGLKNIENLKNDEGMLFPFDENISCSFHMKDTVIGLDIIFIDEKERVILVSKGKPNDESNIECDNVRYVLELNVDSGVSKGDIVEIEDFDDEDTEDDDSKMYIIDSNGRIQMELMGGERIMSRIHTKNLIKLSKKAKKTSDKKNYIKLGKKFLDYLEIQDNQKQEYVEIKDEKD